MIQHRRFPAVTILLAVIVAGWIAISWNPAHGAVTAADALRGAGTRSLEQLEIAIASEHPTAEDWYAYANLLRARRQYPDAAQAYQKTLELQPYNRDARFNCARTLAATGNAEEFYRFMRDLVWSDAKLAVDLFGRSEAQPYLSQARFQTLVREAKDQAMD